MRIVMQQANIEVLYQVQDDDGQIVQIIPGRETVLGGDWPRWHLDRDVACARVHAQLFPEETATSEGTLPEAHEHDNGHVHA